MLKPTSQKARIVGLAAMFVGVVTLGLVTTASAANFPNKPLRWAKRGFSKHGEAVEHITLRGAAVSGHETFIRWSMANAGYKKGQLTITFLQQSPGGTLYAEKTLARGKYQVGAAALSIQAAGNTLAVKDGKLVMRFALGKVTGDATLSSERRGPIAKDRAGGGFIHRDLVSAWGQLQVKASTTGGRTCDLTSTVWTVHEASTVKAHRVYDRSIQFHKVRGKFMRVVDYIVGPKERAHRPLGFVILRAGGSFVGTVTAEKRANERKDKDNDYQVPWLVQVTGTDRAGKTANVQLTAKKRVKRKDDLAGLGWFARKAVSMFMHPFTYTLRGELQATIDGSAKPLAAKGKWKYAQTRE